MCPDRDQYLSNVAQAAVLLFQTLKKLFRLLHQLCLKQLCDFFSQAINYIYTHTHTGFMFKKVTDGIAPQFLQSCEKTGSKDIQGQFACSSVCLIM